MWTAEYNTVERDTVWEQNILCVTWNVLWTVVSMSHRVEAEYNTDDKDRVCIAWNVSWTVEFFKISLHHKNGNVVNFILAVPFKIEKTNKFCNYLT